MSIRIPEPDSAGYALLLIVIVILGLSIAAWVDTPLPPVVSP